ncbi:hypothetical protein O181_099081 [Austropuccinia psidii MF-1]|uniref:Uncharacterized protein n=1 Tax=Austropuccinia psidii MF-1 TaxID=1389203 RepID=A0A9Q3JCQ7_9BASI|nr:hypothetical protein [Austropuccinia psidii MF-1]
MTWPIGPNLAPGWIAATIKEEGQTRACDRQPHSFQYSLDSSRPVFQSYIMGKSIKTVHFPSGKVDTSSSCQYSFKDSIQTICQPEGIPLSAFHIYQPPLTLGGFPPVN